MLGCRLPDAGRRMKWSAKRVESFWVPCLDAGSTPATSTPNSCRADDLSSRLLSSDTIRKPLMHISNVRIIGNNRCATGIKIKKSTKSLLGCALQYLVLFGRIMLTKTDIEIHYI